MKLPNAGVIPVAPSGLNASLSFDLSPLRPSQWEVEDAFTWNRAVADRQAYREGIEQARKEAEGPAHVQRMLEAKRGLPEA